MKFHIIGNTDAPKMLLIHGALTPWTIWTPQIEHFSSKYCVIVPELDAHQSDVTSEFVSIEKEAESIEKYCLENNFTHLFAVCGLSLGGAIAHVLWKRNNVNIKNLILDGAPLVPSHSLLTRIMTNNYLSIVSKSKKRDAKTLDNFKKHFLPEKYLNDYLSFIDNMGESSVKNMLFSVGQSKLIVDTVADKTNVVYMHGTAVNELLSKKSAKLIKKHYPKIKVITFCGDTHCYKAIYEPSKWISIVEENLY